MNRTIVTDDLDVKTRWLGPDGLVHITALFPTRKEFTKVYPLGSYTPEYIAGVPTGLQRQSCCRMFLLDDQPELERYNVWNYQRPVTCLGCLAEVG